MKKSTILRKARELIQSGERYYICSAITYIHSENAHNPKTVRNCRELEAWIHTLLGDQVSLNAWLVERISEEAYGNGVLFERKLRATRIAWLNWMIEHWERKVK